ncbi:MAG: omptin family outer membrane protease [Treponema sp.]|nr:omptin family outer membrane protease [Treponema sp.]
MPYRCSADAWKTTIFICISHYSRHDLHLDKRYGIALDAGYTFTIRWFSIAPGIGLGYRNQAWTAYDGYLQYPASGKKWTGTESKQAVSGTIVSYEQHILMPFIALKAQFTFSTAWKLELQSTVCPYLFVWAVDRHYKRSMQFDDAMHGGVGTTVQCTLSYRQFFIRAAYEYVSVMNGTTSVGAIGAPKASFKKLDGVGTGTGSHLWTVTCGYTFLIGK